MNELMSTREVADYLRIKERKVYDLVRQGRIPCSRVTGKWLFPKSLIDLWVLESVRLPAGMSRRAAPPRVVAGSHDPLLEWAVRESGSELALYLAGSLDGLKRFAARQAMACGLHVRDARTGEWNVPVVRGTLGVADVVLVEWARRQQGLIVAAGNPLAIAGLADLAKPGLRIVDRQAEAGSRILFQHLLAEAGVAESALTTTRVTALSESDLAEAIRDGQGDAGFGIACVARQAGLDFVPLAHERYDLLVGRRDYFEPPVQRLLAFARTPRFAERARALGGYEVGEAGRIVFNG